VSWLRAAAGALAVVCLLAPSPAAAEDVTRAELRQLVVQAEGDPAALARLRQVDAVDGVPVDMRRALNGDVEARLRALAGGGAAASIPPAAAREQAEAILAERRFHEHVLPRPLAGVLTWIGERLQPLVDAVTYVADRFPGGSNAFWVALGALVAAAAAFVAVRLGRRRVAAAAATGVLGRRPGAAGPDELERLAGEAERRGDHEAALRLRFRAGLLRLDAADRLDFRESLTTGAAARELRSAEFDRLARAFDEVVYGRRPPGPEDSVRAREAWRRVLAEQAA
jgi:hypothetical protein